MEMKYIKVLPKEECIAIAKIVLGYKEYNGTEDKLLVCLPNNVFGRVFRVDYTDGNIVVYDDFEGSSKLRWHIPTYFCERASLINTEEKSDA